VIVKKLDGIFDGNHVLFHVRLLICSSMAAERGGLTGPCWSVTKDESAGLVAPNLHDLRQSESVEALDFPRNGTEDGANGSSLIENVATETGQVLQTEGESPFQVLSKRCFCASVKTL